ncbi:zincin-like metallopeptidase domain-containing protein [Roseospira navarrensis]|uniref:zincin-like metallopeptidase domain-containing protein n=1 Tax=Roseospira navarrensis TaxID=140058 RepID=UPI0031B59D81
MDDVPAGIGARRACAQGREGLARRLRQHDHPHRGDRGGRDRRAEDPLHEGLQRVQRRADRGPARALLHQARAPGRRPAAHRPTDGHAGAPPRAKFPDIRLHSPGGTEASYNVALDRVRVPPIEAFRDAESFYATLAHEVTHWTRHPDRLARDFGRKTFGDEGYAREELVAELGAAFLCAALDLTLHVREDHAAYIHHWLGILKADKRAIFSAAAHAQRAADYLHGLQPNAEAANTETTTDTEAAA